tara:strand:- start:2194 stop:2448 length:255 start_codon:yes stop_codon:yes gene_type:complete
MEKKYISLILNFSSKFLKLINKIKANIEEIKIFIEYKLFEKKINNKIKKNKFILFSNINKNHSLVFLKCIKNKFKKTIIITEIL